ncbi:MAG: WxL domain-containing protein [Lachnospiraceae bacterium]
MKSKKLKAVIAFAFAATMMLSSVMGVAAADPVEPDPNTDISVSDNKITFQTGGGGEATGPVDPEKPDESVVLDEVNDVRERITDNRGELRLDVVPVFDFGTQNNTVGEKIYSAVLPKDLTTSEKDPNIPYYVQVTDLRGTGAGWTLSAKMTSQFTDTASHSLDGATIDFTNTAAASKTGTVAPTTVTTASQLYYTTANNAGGGNLVVIAQAATNEGMGVSAIRFGDTARHNDAQTVTADKSVKLTIPATTQVYSSKYNATIQWTLTVGP